jgi:hypothetical protein
MKLNRVDTIKKISGDLFAAATQSEESELELRIQRFYQETNPERKLGLLETLEQYLVPSDVDQALDEIQGSIDLIENAEEKKALQETFERVQFQQVFPIVAELNPQAQGFAQELLRITEIMDKTHQIDSLKTLNQEQLQEVMKISRRSA